MKKCLAILLTAILAISFISCGIDNSYKYPAPENGIFNAPQTFYFEWDIPSVRDVSAEKEGHYSMPVYMFETYEELLHLKEIVGMDEIGNEINNDSYCEICPTSAPCSHDKYDKEFFEHYTLLIGWHQYAGVVLGEHVQHTPDDSTNQDEITEDVTENADNESTDNAESDSESSVAVAKYEIAPDGSLTVFLQGQKSESNDTPQQWVLVAVPKDTMQNCDSIAFFVVLPTEE